jgi:hypothetical protein
MDTSTRSAGLRSRALLLLVALMASFGLALVAAPSGVAFADHCSTTTTGPGPDGIEGTEDDTSTTTTRSCTAAEEKDHVGDQVGVGTNNASSVIGENMPLVFGVAVAFVAWAVGRRVLGKI